MSTYLPEKIFLYCKKPTNANVPVSSYDNEEEDDVTEVVRHTFPVSDQSTQSRHENAENWSTQHIYKGKSAQITVVRGDMFEYQNNGFDSVTIKDLEVRGQGGRAYQVILEHDGKKFRVDLREDTLMDVIHNTGIQAGGRLNGTFCFIVEGSQTNLVREDSKVWKSAQKGSEARKNTTLKKSDLKIGHQYKSLSGDVVIYLGSAYSRSISIKQDKNSGHYDRKLGTFDYGKMSKKMIFIDGKDGKKALEDFKKGDTRHWSIKVQTSHSYREDLGKVGDINTEDIIPLLNALGQKHYTEHINSQYSARHILESYELIELSTTKELNTDQSKIDNAFAIYEVYHKQYHRRGW